MGCVAVCKAIGNNIGDQARGKAIAFCRYVRVFVHSSRCTRLVLCIEVLRLILSLLEASHAPALLGSTLLISALATIGVMIRGVLSIPSLTGLKLESVNLYTKNESIQIC